MNYSESMKKPKLIQKVQLENQNFKVELKRIKQKCRNGNTEETKLINKNNKQRVSTNNWFNSYHKFNQLWRKIMYVLIQMEYLCRRIIIDDYTLKTFFKTNIQYIKYLLFFLKFI